MLFEKAKKLLQDFELGKKDKQQKQQNSIKFK